MSISNYMLEIVTTIQTMSIWEAIAVGLAFLYLWLAIRQNIWCWVSGFVSTFIYLYLFWKVSLFSESLLQIFYLFLSVYGWLQWRSGSQNNPKKIISWPLKKHLMVIVLTTLSSLFIGYLMFKYTPAKFPYLDAATSTFAILTTFMVTRKVLENWIYWVLIDSVSIYLYFNRGLYLTSILFIVYIIMCFFGYIKWLKNFNEREFSLG